VSSPPNPIRALEFDSTGDLTVEIGSHTGRLTVEDAIFGAEEGALVMAPGSSGGEDPYMEVVHRGGSAAETFAHPTPGDTVSFE
jgi:hypothetical protein